MKYRQLNNAVKESANKDKNYHYEEKAESAQMAADVGNMKVVYNITRGPSGKKRRSEAGIKATDGKVIKDHVKVAETWIKHFQEVLKEKLKAFRRFGGVIIIFDPSTTG